jgi:transcriptional regulator with XRE-family HTH domain
MDAGQLSHTLETLRLRIARRVRELRTQRAWTQQDLAERLQLSQGRLSDLERGNGAFTAEQFLTILSIFNVPATYFARETQKQELDLQNALARHGATHLHESTEVLPSERLDELPNVVREALVAQSPRQITALAPVLVRNVEHLNLRKLHSDLRAVGLDHRLAWVVENTVTALHVTLGMSNNSAPWTPTYRRAELVLGTLLEFLLDQESRSRHPAPLDVLDPDIVTKQTLEEVRAASSPISQRWGIVTSLQPHDFIEALGAANNVSR